MGSQGIKMVKVAGIILIGCILWATYGVPERKYFYFGSPKKFLLSSIMKNDLKESLKQGVQIVRTTDNLKQPGFFGRIGKRFSSSLKHFRMMKKKKDAAVRLEEN